MISQEMISNFRILENDEKKVSILKNTRHYLFSIKNKHFGWRQQHPLKEIRKYPDLQKKIILNENHLKIIVDNFKKWKSIPTYLMFKDLNNGYLSCALASKRGNKIYEYYLNEKLDQDLKFMKNSNFHKLIIRDKKGFRNQKISNLCFITLTCDPKKYDENRIKAWLNFEHDYNIFITRFRKKFGKCWIMKSVESTKKGFPHIHLLVITEKVFDVFKPTRRKCENKDCKKYFNVFSEDYFIICPYCNSKVSHPYRMVIKKELKNYWTSNFDILTPDPTQMKKPKKDCANFMKDYIFKDMIKAYRYKEQRTYQNNLSLALGWIFGKRCYSISKMNLSLDLITDTSVTQTQIEDFRKQNPNKKYLFLGLIDFKFKSNKPPPISFEISKTDEIYEDCLSHIYGLRKKLIIEIKPNNQLEERKTWFECTQLEKLNEEIKTKGPTKKIFFMEGSDKPLIISYHNPLTAERFEGSMKDIRRNQFIKELEKEQAIIPKRLDSASTRAIIINRTFKDEQ